MKKLYIFIFALFSAYSSFAPVFNSGTVWEQLSTPLVTAGLIVVLIFPVFFFVQSYFVMFPFKTISKVLFFTEGVLLVYCFLAEIIGFAFVRGWTENQPHFFIFKMYILSQNLFFALWCFVLISPLSGNKIINWPFKVDAERQKTKKEDEFKNRHRYR
jgi:hypothetical protein